ncbi:hypothetical protein [Blastococcus tunisiensis]|uniref:Uncharacterized protein n=1 Tax=Blastococcus tunisiensis TaxID=1798228 RepID=A0A1I2BDC6_9ACTN|nr:hypothetical protein [Blastococcus sp. DSM 46838]SFE54086.1 hypothetical protein SAMN05216574_104127 [Blastococcus sp. DSM 46838]
MTMTATVDAADGIPAAAGVRVGPGRVAAVLALASAAVHLLLVDASSLGSLVMVAMAAACLPCAWHLWRSPTPSVWGTTAAIDTAMLLLHAQMLAGVSGHTGHGGAPAGSLMWLGLGLVGAQLAVAGAAVLRR